MNLRRRLGLMILLVAWGCQPAVDPMTVWVARVGGEVITRGDVEAEATRVSAGGLKPATPEAERRLRLALLDDMIRERLLLIEAKRRNVVVAPAEVDQRLNDLLDNGAREAGARERNLALSGLSGAALKSRVGERLRVEKLLMGDVYPRLLVSDEDVKAAFEKDKARYARPERIRVRQIVVASEEDAARVTARLGRGESFAKVAHEMSITPERDRGGDLGLVSRQDLPDPFGKWVFELPRDVVTRPVKSDYGYHVFYLSDDRAAREPSLADVRPLVERAVFAEKKEEAERALLAHLSERLHVQRNPDFLKEMQTP